MSKTLHIVTSTDLDRIIELIKHQIRTHPEEHKILLIHVADQSAFDSELSSSVYRLGSHHHLPSAADKTIDYSEMLSMIFSADRVMTW